ncbi:MAG: hypothetical protein AB7O49_02120 [Sphingomonadales bacterium]
MDAASTQDGARLAASVYRALIGERAGDKYKARDLASAQGGGVDRAVLRSLLMTAIAGDYAAGKEEEREDESIAATRSWLVGMLARISAGDEAAIAMAAAHLEKTAEPNHWARYWALEGLIFSGNPGLEELARKAAAHVDDKLVSLLADAWLATRGDRKALAKVRKALEAGGDDTWFALRALRVVPVPATVPTLCEIVRGGIYSDVTYDAVMALGIVPGDWSHATAAAQALSATVVSMRGAAWKDGMRTGAITGLGNLRVESAAPLLVEELADDNPAIVREAARALERILGLGVAVTRVTEAAARSDEGGMIAYGRALRWLNRDAVAEELEALMGAGAPRQQEAARALLSELGGAVAFQKLRARADVMKQYSDVLEKAEEKIRLLFEASVIEAQHGFRLAVIMDVAVFAVGVLLLVGSACYALWAQGDIASWAGVGLAGGTGVLGMVYGVLIANPRKQVRESVDHLMRVKMVFLAYLRRLHQADQAYARRLLDDKPVTVEEVLGFSNAVGGIMDQTLAQRLDGAAAGSAKD